MVKIIYKKGCEGQNKLSCIEGIEIELLNGQKALIYPKYAERQMLKPEHVSEWSAKNETEIEALKVENTGVKTSILYAIGSPAARWVINFESDKHGLFYLPSLIAALEIQHQAVEIDALAETIEGADLLKDFASGIWSCSRYISYYGWFAGGYGYAAAGDLYFTYLAVPTILYR